MKKYVTFVRDAEESRKVQKALFKSGFKWKNGCGSDVINTDKRILLINYSTNKTISFCRSMVALDGGRIFDLCQPMTPQDIISNPFRLDGAKQPEKMIEVKGRAYSEDSLHVMIKAYTE